MKAALRDLIAAALADPKLAALAAAAKVEVDALRMVEAQARLLLGRTGAIQLLRSTTALDRTRAAHRKGSQAKALPAASSSSKKPVR